MGSSFKVDQAFLYEFVDKFYDLEVSHENIEYRPVLGTPYAEIMVLGNNITPYSLAHTDETDGVFRIILRYPKGSGQVDIKTKADEIFSVFKIGKKLTNEGVSVTVTSQARQSGVPESGWFKIVLTIGYKAYLRRQ